MEVADAAEEADAAAWVEASGASSITVPLGSGSACRIAPGSKSRSAARRAAPEPTRGLLIPTPLPDSSASGRERMSTCARAPPLAAAPLLPSRSSPALVMRPSTLSSASPRAVAVAAAAAAAATAAADDDDAVLGSACDGVSRAQRIVWGPRWMEPGSVSGGRRKAKSGRWRWLCAFDLTKAPAPISDGAVYTSSLQSSMLCSSSSGPCLELREASCTESSPRGRESERWAYGGVSETSRYAPCSVRTIRLPPGRAAAEVWPSAAASE